MSNYLNVQTLWRRAGRGVRIWKSVTGKREKIRQARGREKNEYESKTNGIFKALRMMQLATMQVKSLSPGGKYGSKTG